MPPRRTDRTAGLSERKAVETAPAESERRFRDFAEAASGRLWEMDGQFRFTYVSPLPEGALRLAANAMIGQRRWDLPGIDKTRRYKT